MPKADWRRIKGARWPAVALVLAVPLGLLAQGGQGQRDGGAGGAAPPAGAAQAPQAPGQGRGGQRPGGPGGAAASARAAAPVDLTGYWVSIVTEDWIERMSPDSPPSGVPRGGGAGGGGGRGGGGRGGGGPQAVSPPPAGERCRAYAAGGSLRVPGRLNITWADDNTLKIDMDSGTQTRLLHFNSNQPAPAQRTLQGHSVATWDTGRGGGGFGGGGRGGGAPAAPRWGSLRVVTTSMTGGYLLSSRNTYSENATLTEHFTRHSDFGADYFTVTAIISDGGNDRITSSTFKKEPDGSKFRPSGCEVVR
ncbi:MAG TPA: hypothetical protein VFV95_05860 [Vicinamibacterales bacterium]|nr:hypothetical protein [Vicinamibacterales bacterium]